MKLRAPLALVAALAAGCASAPTFDPAIYPPPRRLDPCRPDNWHGYRHAQRCWEIAHPVEAGIGYAARRAIAAASRSQSAR